MGVTERIQQDFRARIVYHEPIERDDITLLPAARVVGGGGGGGDEHGGEGGGFGLSATPSGAWVIQGGRARWKPAIDVMVIVAGGVCRCDDLLLLLVAHRAKPCEGETTAIAPILHLRARRGPTKEAPWPPAHQR